MKTKISSYFYIIFLLSAQLSFLSAFNPVQESAFLDNGDNVSSGDPNLSARTFPEGRFTYLNDSSKLPGINFLDPNLVINVEYGALFADNASDLGLSFANQEFGNALANVRLIASDQVFTLSSTNLVGAPLNRWKPDSNKDGVIDWYQNLRSYIFVDARAHPTYDLDGDGIPYWIERMYTEIGGDVQQGNNDDVVYYAIDNNNQDIPGGIYLRNPNDYIKYTQKARFMLNLGSRSIRKSYAHSPNPLGIDIDGDALRLLQEVRFKDNGYMNVRLLMRHDTHCYVYVNDNKIELIHHGNQSYVPTTNDHPVAGLWVNDVPIGLSWSQTVQYDNVSNFNRPLLVTPVFDTTSIPVPSDFPNPSIVFNKDLPANVFADLVRVPQDYGGNRALVALVRNTNESNQEARIAFSYRAGLEILSDHEDLDTDNDGDNTDHYCADRLSRV